MAIIDTYKDRVDIAITNKTDPLSIPPQVVGQKFKDLADIVALYKSEDLSVWDPSIASGAGYVESAIVIFNSVFYKSLVDANSVEPDSDNTKWEVLLVGGGTVTTLSIANVNGISGTITNPTTTPIISLLLGDISPSSVNGVAATTLAFLDVSSSVQTQLDGKQSSFTLTTDGGDGPATFINNILNIPQYSALGGGLVSSFNTRTGIVSLLNADVTSALGYTPYDASNPNGYINSNLVSSVFGRTSNVTAQSGDYAAFYAAKTNPTFSGVISGGNVALTSSQYILFNGTSDLNWRMGYHTTSFTYSTVSTPIDIVVGTNSNDGFAIGGTGGASFFELKGSDSSAFFRGVVTTNDLDNYASDLSGSYTSRSKIDKAYADATYAPLAGSGVASFNTRTGAVTLSSSDVTTALTFTPYNSTNPSGFITISSTDTLTNKSGAISQWTNDSGYLTGNQSITLSGDISGTGSTAITTVIGAGKVTNAMLAGSIDLTTKVTGLLPDSRISSATAWNAKQAALSGTGFVKSTAGTISYDTNTYLTTNAVSSVFTRTGAVTAQSGDYTTAQVTESGNLYFTTGRVLATTLVGFVSGTGSVTATDTTLSALQKLNGNIGALVTGVSSFNTRTGAISLSGTDVTNALTFTPYNATNPSAFISLTALSATSPIFYNNSTGVISSQAATSLLNGYLTSADWVTFNGKQATLSGTGFVKSTAGTISYDTSTYITGNQTITLSGDVTGSGTTGLVTTIKTDVVLAGNPTTTTQTLGNNTTRIATTAFVAAAVSAATAGVASFNGRTGTVVPVIGDYAALVETLTNKDLTSGTNTFPTFNQNTTGSAGKWTTARNLAGNSVDGTGNVAFANKFIVQGTTDTGLSAAQFLGALATGIVKNTTTTGVLSIAVAGTDYEVPLTFSTGLTRTTNTITVNSSQSISTLSNLTSNGLIKTSGGTGALSIATAGTDYQVPISLTVTGSSGAATFVSNTLNVPTYTLAGLGGITLTSISATSPIFYNNSTGVISSQAATTSVNGYLTSTDWNTFSGKQDIISLTTTGTSGAATLVGTTLNIPQYIGTTYTFSTGLTNTSGTVTVNASQVITTLSNLTSNGLIKTSGGGGTLSIATAGTDYVAPTTTVAGFALSGNVTLGALTATNTTLTFTGSYDGSTSRTVGLNLSNTNTWAALQTFGTNISIGGITATGAQGTGNIVFATSPTLTTPTIGVATATSINKVTITAPATSAILTIANSKTLTVSNTLTLAGTDSTTMTFPSTSATIARTDAANTFTGTQTISNTLSVSGTINSITNNLFVPLASGSSAQTITFGGVSSNFIRTILGASGTTSTALTTGVNYANTIIGSAPVTTFTSGTHAWVANAVISPVGTITNSGATVTNTASLYIDSAGTGGTNNYAFYVAAGNVNVQSLTASQAIFTDANKNLVSNTITGTGNVVMSTSPTLVTPILGIPTSVTLTNATGLVLTSGTGVTGILPVANGGTGANTLTGLVKGNGTSAFTAASAGTDYQIPITLTTTGTSGAATFTSGTLNIPQYTGGTTYTFSTGLTNTSGTVTVNTSQNISTLSNLTSNGLVKTSGGTGALSIATAGTDYQAALTGTGFVKSTAGTISYDTSTYLTANQSITLSGDISGTGTTAITTTIGASKVTNTMLAGSIDLTTKVIGLLPDANISSASTWNGKFTLPALTNHSVLFSNGTTISQDNNNFYYNSTGALLSVAVAGDFTGTNSVNIYGQYDSYQPQSAIGTVTDAATTPGFTASTSRGTGSVPIINNTGDLIGGFSGWAYTGSSPAFTYMAGVAASAVGATSTNLGGQLDFYVKADNGSAATAMTIANDKTITMSKYGTGLLHSTSGGVISSSAVSLTADVTGLLGLTNLDQSITPTWTGLHTSSAAFTTAKTPLIRLSNTTTAVASTNYSSPEISWQAPIFDVSATNIEVRALVKGLGASSAGYGQFILEAYEGGTYSQDIFNVDNSGNGFTTGSWGVQHSGITTSTTTDGLNMLNFTAAISGTQVQNSSVIRWMGSRWTGAANNWSEWIQGVQNTGGATGFSSMVISHRLSTNNTGSYVPDIVINSNGQLTTGQILLQPHTLTAINSTATATSAQLHTGVITSTSGAATTITLPTATLLATELGAVQGTTFDFIIDNSAGANIVTLILGTGMTALAVVTGSNTLTTAAGSTGYFRLYFKSTTTASFMRLG
jgi:hypothetical protein